MHGNGSVQGSRPFIDRHRSLAAGRQASAAAIVDKQKEREKKKLQGFRGPANEDGGQVVL